MPTMADGILSEIDVVAALEMTTGDAIVDAKIRALVSVWGCWFEFPRAETVCPTWQGDLSRTS